VAEWVERVLLPLGVWGLGLAAILDSWFLPFPSGVDLWMITLCVQNPAKAPLYVAVSTLGSLAGSSLLYFLVRKGEEAILRKQATADKLARVRQRIERSGTWALTVAALLPPPAPFKLFILTAAVLQFPWPRFALGLLIGRVIRYSLEAFLAVRYGRQAWQLLLTAGPAAFAVGVLAILLVILILRRRSSQTAAA
jgi:membrane protein YqaA with SNARE-associated domain